VPWGEIVGVCETRFKISCSVAASRKAAVDSKAIRSTKTRLRNTGVRFLMEDLWEEL